MKLKFNKRQYQIDAANSVVDIFSGQPKGTRKDLISREGFLTNEIFSNKKIELTDGEMLENVREVQKENGLKLSKKLYDNNFTVEMETGTGKTFVYTQTMFELNERYGWNKFIVMTPSVAIREGVKKSFENTQEYFYEKYGKKIRSFIYDTSNSSNLINIKNFATKKDIQVIIMNYQAFSTRSKQDRKIYQKLDKLQSRKPINIIKQTKPILIIDEPQKFGSVAEKMIAEFDPLFKLRYSATHKKDYNKVYRLDAIDAFNKKLVKKIKVKGIEVKGSEGTNSYLFLDRIKVSKDRYPVAYIELEVKQENGIRKKIRKIEQGDDLFYLSKKLKQYKGFKVKEINAKTNTVSFTNGEVLSTGEATGDVDEKHIRRVQIRETIASHLEKEKKMFKKGIKVLSLFFIDEVAKYRQYDENGNELKGEYQKIFEEEYKKAIKQVDLLNEDYNDYLDEFSVDEIHKAYFSIDRTGKWRDTSESSRSRNAKHANRAYELIMKDKEQLLSFEEPTRFIFSHSALREGWDNPNVFQICTLKHSDSTVSRRQEIGRGLRISVDDEGNRMDFPTLGENYFDINTLTVVANESYKDFAKGLQDEVFDSLSDRPRKVTPKVLDGRLIVNEGGEELKFDENLAMDLIFHLKSNDYLDDNYLVQEKLIVDIENNDFEVPEKAKGFEKEIAELLKGVYDTENYKAAENEKADNIHESPLEPNDNFSKEEFQKLWNKIKVKSVYNVNFDSQELIEKSIQKINSDLSVKKVVIKTEEGEQKEKVDRDSLRRGDSIKTVSSKQEYREAILGEVKYDLIGQIIKKTKLTRETVVKILKGLSEEKFAMFRVNPEDFIRKVAQLIKEQKATTLINNITYSKLNRSYSGDVFTINDFKGSLKNNVLEVKKHIYDYLKVDSNVEKKFAEKLESGEISVYAKLPSGFKIPTPVGDYNPDWAIVIDSEKAKYIYFIAETKGDLSSMQLRDQEKLKIKYAKKHFEALNEKNLKYEAVESYDDLMQKVFK